MSNGRPPLCYRHAKSQVTLDCGFPLWVFRIHDLGFVCVVLNYGFGFSDVSLSIFNLCFHLTLNVGFGFCDIGYWFTELVV